MAENNQFHLRIITPTRVFYENDAHMLEFTSTEGEMGVYARHVPTTLVLEPGIMTVTEVDGTQKKAALHEGFVEILENEITVMAEIAEWPDEIDYNRAKEARIRAERRLTNKDPHTNYNRAQIALRKALVRQRLAEEKNI